jgi:hypothetical protein
MLKSAQLNHVLGHLNNAAATYKRVTYGSQVPDTIKLKFEQSLLACADAAEELKAYYKTAEVSENGVENDG